MLLDFTNAGRLKSGAKKNLRQIAVLAATILVGWLAIAGRLAAEEQEAGDKKKTAATEVRALLEKGQTNGSFSDGMIVRIGACLGEADAEGRNERAPAGLVESWEFAGNQVHRVEPEYREGKITYRRVEPRRYDSKNICKDLLDGKAIEIGEMEKALRSCWRVPPPYHRGSRSIEILWNGKTVSDLHETNGPTWDAYRESDARAFGALYERLATPGACSRHDRTISHVYIPRRDRLARPNDPLDATTLENSLLRLGVSIIMMGGKVVAPIKRGRRQNLADTLQSLIEYDQAGRDRQELARKVLLAQISLAEQGYSIGGRPPYGFARWLVSAEGAKVRPLLDGERVRMRGHHVVWLPLPDEDPSWANIRRILESLETMPACRVAAMLTAEGVPSPDSGRLRTDGGVRHKVSGAWHQATVVGIARNPLLKALVVAGRRSMGDQLRHSPEGPRELDDFDYRADDRPKVIRNPETNHIVAAAHFEPRVDPDRHAALLAKLDERAGAQRGKPRSRKPDQNPLGGRIFDMACGWPMYRAPYSRSFRYTCGAYSQSHGVKCKHNHVDGPMAAGFVLATLRQRLLGPKVFLKLRKRLHHLAATEAAATINPASQAIKQSELAELDRQLAVVKRNLALAENEEQRKATAEVFEELNIKRNDLQAALGRVPSVSTPQRDSQVRVEAALRILDTLPSLLESEDSLAAVGKVFAHTNARLFLRFRPLQVKKRVLNKVAGGVVAFGTAPAPVELYRGPTGRRALIETKTAAVAVGSPAVQPVEPPNVGQEETSLGNVSRGDRI